MISEEGKVIKRITVYLSKGLGTGDFALADSLASEEYTIRAYTNWMRNFDQDFFFQKQIKLIDPVAKQIVSNSGSTTPFQIKFFPEGGELIAGITSKVAFEVNSLEDQLFGEIIDDLGNVITVFETAHQGMGSFDLKPIADRTTATSSWPRVVKPHRRGTPSRTIRWRRAAISIGSRTESRFSSRTFSLDTTCGVAFIDSSFPKNL